jgi:hypothetical protein
MGTLEKHPSTLSTLSNLAGSVLTGGKMGAGGQQQGWEVETANSCKPKGVVFVSRIKILRFSCLLVEKVFEV